MLFHFNVDVASASGQMVRKPEQFFYNTMASTATDSTATDSTATDSTATDSTTETIGAGMVEFVAKCIGRTVPLHIATAIARLPEAASDKTCIKCDQPVHNVSVTPCATCGNDMDVGLVTLSMKTLSAMRVHSS
jgi:hypothetical protein